jgi:hydroxyacylglutathione hydrolase
MIFEQHYLDCLSQASYLIGDETTGRAVVVDPRRDIAPYLESAAEHGLTIELVIETHFHADFLSGHLELAEATGAEIGFGSRGRPEFAARALHDRERVSLGDVTLEIRETPGHTPESISIVVYERPDDEIPYGVLTGDTLFIGDVGRPDLLASMGVTADDLARQLYESLHEKLLVLPDATRVYPAHGAGSACGKNLSTDTWSTIGDQRVANYAVQPMTCDEFVAVVTEGQPAAPGYFSFDARRNRERHDLFDPGDAPASLSLADALARVAEGAVLLDTRDVASFAAGHVFGAQNVGLDGRFAEYVGSVVRPDEEIVIVADPGTEIEARIRLARIGFDRVTGGLADPYVAFQDAPDAIAVSSRLTVDALEERRRAVSDLQIVDVRTPGEAALGTIDGALHIPLVRLRDRLDELDADRPTVVYCAGGYRSSIGSSLLRRSGFADVSDLVGGYEAWARTRVDLGA